MEKWYYIENDEKQGPFSLSELQDKHLKKDTLVWTESMSDWKRAAEIGILQDIIEVSPPPTPKEKALQEKQPGSDNTAESDVEEIQEYNKAERPVYKYFGDVKWNALIMALTFLYFAIKLILRQNLDFTLWEELIFLAFWVYNKPAVLIGLKRYMKNVNKVTRSGGILNVLVILTVTFVILTAIQIIFFNEGNTTLEWLTLVVAAITFVGNIVLVVQLFMVRNDYSGFLHTYAFSLILVFIITVVLAFVFVPKEDFLRFAFYSVMFSIIPYAILFMLFKKTQHLLRNEAEKGGGT